MQINSVKHYQTQNKNNLNFNGFSDEFFRFLATNQAIGANAVDLSFMVLPRTIIDFKNRGVEAGFETGRREASGTTNHTLIGVYGGLTGFLLAALHGFKNKFDADVNKIYAAPEILTILSENKTQQLKAKESQLDYISKTLSNLKLYNPTSVKADKEGYVQISEKVINEVSTILNEAINDGNYEKFAGSKSIKNPNSVDLVVNKIVADTGAKSKYILRDGANDWFKSSTDLKTFIKDYYKISVTFNKDKVKQVFLEQIKDNIPVASNKFVSKVIKFMKQRSLMGFLIGSGVGMSVQPINMYLTKKKTGTDGFVGVEGRSKDNSLGFKLLKGAAGGGFLGMTMLTLKTGFKGFMGKMAFEGFWPSINQLKGIYGLTIISRLLSARDKDELRESLTKDTLGYLSWLVLGDIVNKLVATALDKNDATVLNTTDKDVKGVFQKMKRAFYARLKTRDEVVIDALSKNNIDITKIDGDKVVAKKFREMLKDLNKLPEAAQKVVKRQLRTLKWAQISGYAFSGLVLGMGIPKLNIAITNSLDKKRKAKSVALNN